MIIVAGKIYVKPGRREAYLGASMESVSAARRAPGCIDFVVAADPLEPDRVNIFEQWESERELEAFRGAGPSDDFTSEILRANVLRHQISSSGPA